MRGNSNTDRNNDRKRGIQHWGMHIGTQNKAIVINFCRVGILCLIVNQCSDFLLSGDMAVLLDVSRFWRMRVRYNISNVFAISKQEFINRLYKIFKKFLKIIIHFILYVYTFYMFIYIIYIQINRY